MTEKRFKITEYGSDYYIEIIDNEKELDESIPNSSQVLGLVECVDLLNNQAEKIKVLQNSCEIMNQRLSEKSKCDYKKAIIEFCKFMNINTPLLDVMVDEFLQEMF